MYCSMVSPVAAVPMFLLVSGVWLLLVREVSYERIMFLAYRFLQSQSCSSVRSHCGKVLLSWTEVC